MHALLRKGCRLGLLPLSTALLAILLIYAHSLPKSLTKDIIYGKPEVVNPTVLQIVAVWNGNATSMFVPQLFSTIGQLSGVARLLYINRDMGQGCGHWDPYLKINVQGICLKNEVYWSYVAKFLCRHWQCTDAQYHSVLQNLITRGDMKNVAFKPLVGQIFQDFVFDHRYAAWTDVDVMYGDLKRLPSYALDGTFDVFTIDRAAGDSDNVYMRGQFTALKRSEKTDNAWHAVPEMASPEVFIESFPRGSLDERYWSNAYMVKSDLNWLQLGTAQGGDGDLTTEEKSVQESLDILQVPLNYTRAETRQALLGLQDLPYPDTFTPSKEHEMQLTSECPGHWLQDNTTCCVIDAYSSEASPEEKTVLYTARYNGRVYQSSVPLLASRSYRKMFQHFQTIKRRKWFALPQRVKPGDIWEFSRRHLTTWDMHTGRSFNCMSNDQMMDLCPKWTGESIV